MNIDDKDPILDDDSADKEREEERSIEDDLGETVDEGHLNYNEEDDSFEYDVKGDDPDYDHPDPYHTSAKSGEDFNSTYDEANPYDTADEYIPNESLETDVDQLGMHISRGEIVETNPIDEALSRTPEDDRDDLDEEGYPKNDRKY
jgi:hypothetical protein